MTLKVAARTVQTTVHMERKLTKKREGLREGRHLALPPGLPQGPPPTAEEPPEPGRLALRRVRQAQLEAQSSPGLPQGPPPTAEEPAEPGLSLIHI